MIERVRQITREDRCRTIDEVSMLVGISHGTYHKILTEDLKMRRVASTFVPILLGVDQKQQRLDVCLDLKENAANANARICRHCVHYPIFCWCAVHR